MEIITHNEHTYLLRFDRGEEVISGLKQFCRKHDITAAHLTALGAAETVELAFYELDRKEYDTWTVDEVTEIASVIGNVALADNEPLIHAHGVFATRTKTHAGHIMQLAAAGTCEVTLTQLPGPITREPDQATGLKLLTSK